MKLLCTVAVLLFAPLAAAQVSTSPGFQLVDYAYSGASGGQTSPGFSATVDLAVLSGAAMSSAGFTADVGFVAAHDPKAGLDPVIFGVSPAFGPKQGGTAITIAGVNFTLSGGGPSTQVLIGGVPAASVAVVSDTQITAVTPANEPGPADVVVQNVVGSDTLAAGYLFTPAVVAPPTAMLGSSVTIEDYGPPGVACSAYWSPVATEIPWPPFGTILIGPTPLNVLFEGVPYPAPDGILANTYPVPSTPSLAGFTLHFQSGAITSTSPLDLQLSNRSTMVLQ